MEGFGYFSAGVWGLTQKYCVSLSEAEGKSDKFSDIVQAMWNTENVLHNEKHIKVLIMFYIHLSVHLKPNM